VPHDTKLVPELPRNPIPRTSVNKGKKKGQHTAPGPTAERKPHQEAQGVRGAAVVQEGLRAFRAGIEGRISMLRRGYALERCLYHGEEGMGRWVGWGILVHNLAKISKKQAVWQGC
jgi:hypothetical protein